jgi:hypothetical protein
MSETCNKILKHKNGLRINYDKKVQAKMSSQMSFTMTPQDLQSMMTSNPDLLMKMLKQNPHMKLVISNEVTEQLSETQVAAPGGAVVIEKEEEKKEFIWSTPIIQKRPEVERTFRIANAYVPPAIEADDSKSDSGSSCGSNRISEQPSHLKPFVKTKLCSYFERFKYCNNGADCSFAHGMGELRQAYKTRMCQYYGTNSCKNGMNCSFAHSRAELRE